MTNVIILPKKTRPLVTENVIVDQCAMMILQHVHDTLTKCRVRSFLNTCVVEDPHLSMQGTFRNNRRYQQYQAAFVDGLEKAVRYATTLHRMVQEQIAMPKPFKADTMTQEDYHLEFRRLQRLEHALAWIAQGIHEQTLLNAYAWTLGIPLEDAEVRIEQYLHRITESTPIQTLPMVEATSDVLTTLVDEVAKPARAPRRRRVSEASQELAAAAA